MTPAIDELGAEPFYTAYKRGYKSTCIPNPARWKVRMSAAYATTLLRALLVLTQLQTTR